MTITAKVTGFGADSTVPHNSGAVDADVYFDGQKVGEVTLLPDHNGRLSIWGEPNNWADPNILDAMNTLDSEEAVVEAVVEAVG